MGTDRCVALVERGYRNWESCGDLAWDEYGGSATNPPLCPRHAKAIWTAWDQHLASLRKYEQADSWSAGVPSRPTEQWEEQGAVYYFEVPGRGIKIGCAADLKDRIRTHRNHWPEGRLLGSEPGWMKKEKRRHEQFAASRLDPRREWFAPSPQLLSHIGSLPGHEERLPV